ncbi:radical SAM protein [Nocardia sp. NPDC060256]|uniref:radical SAM protein n=1 Tax=unclassified Nocardia TaxID=2637762 RepID=UPI003654C35F
MNMVASRYLVVGDRTYRRADDSIVRVGFSSRTGKAFSMDRDTADRLRTGHIEAIAPATLAELTRLGVVVDASRDELDDVLAVFTDARESRRRRTFAIMPTAYCNMGCSYCGQEHFRTRHNPERTERLARRVEAVMEAPETELVTVNWFGGEPLLAYRLIIEMSERFVAKAAETSTEYHARMPTNGSLISVRKLTELHERCRLRHVDITIDGPQEIHDRRRILKNGMNSFHKCVAVLAEIAREDLIPGLRVNIRVNVDNENEPHIPRLLDDLAAAGLNVPRFTVQFAPVHSWGNDVSNVELGIRSFAERELALLRTVADMGFSRAVLPGVKSSTCLATSRGAELHDPTGKVYSCTEYPLVPVVRDTGVLARTEDLVGAQPRPVGPFDDWYDQVADEAQSCHRCPFLPVCGGSCPKLWREGHLPCPSFKFNFQDRLHLHATGALGLRPLPEVSGASN